MIDKLVYYPLLPDSNSVGAKRSNFVVKWIRDYLEPQGLITYNEDEANAYLVASGDGGMTRAARDKADTGKIIFGINCGTLGFLMNQINDYKQIPRRLDELNLIKVNLIEGIFYKRSGENISCLAFNEILCGGNIADYITFEITGSLPHFRNRIVKGNGVTISTPQGTTGYALNSRGSSAVLPLDTKTWYISGIATGPYPSSVVTPQEITLRVSSRHEVHGYADGYGYEVKDIEKVVIRPINYQVVLGFLQGVDFESRRRTLVEQVELGE